MLSLARLCWLVVAVACGTHNSSVTPDTGVGGPTGGTVDGHDWPRFGVDEAQSGVSDAPTGITAAALPTMRRQQVTIDGTVDASAIYLHNVQVNGSPHDVFFVTTTYGKTLAIDASDGTVLWRFTPTNYAQWAGTARITNTTAVADPDRDYVYAASPDGHIQKLAVADGRVVWSTAITLLPTREKIASSLNYSRGHVIAVTGGYVGDAPPYQGHVAVLNAATGQLLNVWNSLCSNRSGLLTPSSCAESGSAIWGRAGAIVAPSTGNILVATGNGRWDGATNWGDAVLELDPNATQLLANYTPTNTDVLEAGDIDVGSTSPALLDAGTVAQSGKDGNIRVIDLALSSGSTPHRGGERQTVRTPSGGAVFSALAVEHGAQGVWMYAADGGGTAAWTYQDGRLTSMWSNTSRGTSPVLAEGMLYVYDPSGPSGTLRVYEAHTGRLLASLACGTGHWNSPIVADGRIALPQGNANDHSTTGVLNIWRLP